MQHSRFHIGGLLMAAASMTVCAQEQPLNVTGTFSTGYYSTSTRGEANQSLSFVPFGAKFEITGYDHSADFLNFSVRPELNAGPQASEAGFQGGNGVQLQVNFLRKILPISFRYSNIQVEDVYFGSLSQISGYSLKDRNKDLGLTLELKNSKLPSTTVDWGINSVDSTSSTAGISDYLSHGNHVNIDSQYERGKWVFDGFMHRQEQFSDLLEPVDGGTHFGTLQQDVLQYQGSVRRGFLGDSEVYLDAGRQSTSSLLFTLPIDLATRYASTSIRLFQKRRWKAAVHAGYSSNAASQLLAQAAASLGGANSYADTAVLAPFSHGISTYNVTANTSFNLSREWTLYGAAERNAIISSSEQGPLDANYFTASAGIAYAHKTGWGGLSGEYGREFGLGSITGQSGTIQGQTYRASVQRGKADGLQVDGSVHGGDESVHNIQPLSNRSLSVEGTVSDRLFGDLSARAGGGWQWSSIVNSANDFRTNGYTARVGIDHPRFQVSATLNDSASTALPFYNDLLGGLGVGSILVTQAVAIPSDYRAMSFTLHANPIRKVELSAVWTRSRQHLDGTLNNDFELLDTYVTYHFRKILVEAGYIRFDQVFAIYPLMLRSRFYVRVVRSAKIL
jgi:hypothetical protein